MATVAARPGCPRQRLGARFLPVVEFLELHRRCHHQPETVAAASRPLRRVTISSISLQWAYRPPGVLCASGEALQGKNMPDFDHRQRCVPPTHGGRLRLRRFGSADTPAAGALNSSPGAERGRKSLPGPTSHNGRRNSTSTLGWRCYPVFRSRPRGRLRVGVGQELLPELAPLSLSE
jgi:hypothetical protein